MTGMTSYDWDDKRCLEMTGITWKTGMTRDDKARLERLRMTRMTRDD